MKFEIEIDETGQITLTKDNEVIIISRRMSRVLDIIEDMASNNGVSMLLTPKTSEIGKLFGM